MRGGSRYDGFPLWQRVLALGLVGQRLAQRGVEIGKSFPVLGGDGNRVAETELVGLQDSCLGGAALALVCYQDGALCGPAHEISKRMVCRQWSCARIDQEQHDIGGSHCHLGLLAHAFAQGIRRGIVQTRRVEHLEFEVAKAGLALTPVAGDAWSVID